LAGAEAHKMFRVHANDKRTRWDLSSRKSQKVFPSVSLEKYQKHFLWDIICYGEGKETNWKNVANKQNKTYTL
jgi:hypothetical protein